MATRSSIRAWEIPWTEEPDGLQSLGHKELYTVEYLRTGTFFFPRQHMPTFLATSLEFLPLIPLLPKSLLSSFQTSML